MGILTNLLEWPRQIWYLRTRNKIDSSIESLDKWIKIYEDEILLHKNQKEVDELHKEICRLSALRTHFVGVQKHLLARDLLKVKL